MSESVQYELIGDVRLPPHVAKAGTIAGWRSAIDTAVDVADCPHWTLGAAAGFVGPVQAICGFDTCGINFSGPSSRGKTTAQALAVSAWTSPAKTSGGLLRSMAATANSLELSAYQSNHTILGLDELAHVDGKTVGQVIYFLAGGVGKARMSAQLTPRPINTWITFVLWSCERSLAQKVTGDGGQWTGGMAVRFVDVDCTDVEAKVPRKTLTAIDGIYPHYGQAGIEFVRAFKAAGLHRETATGKLRTKILTAAETIAGADADGARQRAALPFALIGVCGTLAQEFGVLPKIADIKRAVEWGWERFTSSVEAQALNPEGLALTNLRRWIAEHWDTAIKQLQSSYHNSRDAFGWYDGQAVYIPTARISEAIGGVMSERAFVRLLDRAGLLARRTDQQRAAIRSVPQVGKVDAYALKRREFGHV